MCWMREWMGEWGAEREWGLFVFRVGAYKVGLSREHGRQAEMVGRLLNEHRWKLQMTRRKIVYN